MESRNASVISNFTKLCRLSTHVFYRLVNPTLMDMLNSSRSITLFC